MIWHGKNSLKSKKIYLCKEYKYMSNSIDIGKRNKSNSIGFGNPTLSPSIGFGKRNLKPYYSHRDTFKGRSYLNSEL